jgi:hypothetical protein
MSIGVIESWFLIESRLDETDEDFCSAVESILQEIIARPRWWYPFKAGARFIKSGVGYREFQCVAGSVSMHLVLHAGRDRGIARAIIYRAENDGVHRAYEVRDGVQIEFNPDELQMA